MAPANGSLSPKTTSAEDGSQDAIQLREIDGGPSFYRQFADGLPSDPGFFPLALWSESVVDDTGWPIDRAAGINTYVEPVPGSELARIADNDMYALASWASDQDPVAGYFTADEVDMWAGPGDSSATGNAPGEGPVCEPESSRCGYTIMDQRASAVPSGRMTYTNYGKGVAFWETDGEASQFVNDYQNVVSVDTYWFTDPNICGPSEGGSLLDHTGVVPVEQCRIAANYGRTVDRVRGLVDPPGSKPVWAFVELGHPFTENDAPTITPDEIRAAVWSSILHEARGIVYFNHSFGGDCQTQHVLRDCGTEVRDAVASVNREVTALAPVLASPWVDGLVSPSEGVDAAAKLFEGRFYVLAGAAGARGADMDLQIRCGQGTIASVVGENRSVAITDGHLRDSLADGNSVHIYELSDGNTCGLS